MDRRIEGIIAALMTVIWLVLLNVFFAGKVTAPDQVKILPDMRITYIRLEATPEYTAVSYDNVTMINIATLFRVLLVGRAIIWTRQLI